MIGMGIIGVRKKSVFSGNSGVPALKPTYSGFRYNGLIDPAVLYEHND